MNLNPIYRFSIVLATITVIAGCATSKPPSSETAQTTTSTTGAGDNNYSTNQECVDVIREFEGVRLEAYRGPAGNWLIGYGRNAGVTPGMKISASRAEEMLREDLQRFEQAVTRLVNVPLNRNQFSALVCLAYNIGSGNFASSTLLKKLNENDFDEAANQFGVWRMVNGRVNSHQVSRRARERQLFEM